MESIIIVGAGPAGVSAALYAQSRGQKPLLFEAERIGGLIGRVSKVSHMTGIVVDETGPEYAKRLTAQLKAAGVRVVNERVVRIDAEGERFWVEAATKRYEAARVIVATGATPKDLPIACPDGVRLHHWALEAMDEARGKTVVVCGGSDGATKEALALAQVAKKVHLVQDQPKLLCIDEFAQALAKTPTITVHLRSTVESFDVADGVLIGVRLHGSDALIEDRQGIVVLAQIGLQGNIAPLGSLVAQDGGFLKTNGVESDVPGLWVAGDVRVKPVRQVATAVADGCLAGILASR